MRQDKRGCGWTWRGPAASPRWRRSRRGRRWRRRPGPAGPACPGRAAAAAAGPGWPRPGRCRAERGAEQAAGAGLGQRHQPQRGIAGEAHPVADPADPGPVAAGVGNLQRIQAIEGDGAQPGEAHPRRARLGQRPGHHLEQRLQRRGPQAAAQIPQRLLRRARQVQAGQPGSQLAPHPRVAQPREHAQREHEIHTDPGRQHPQPPLHRPGLLQDIIDQLERQVLRLTRPDDQGRTRPRRQ